MAGNDGRVPASCSHRDQGGSVNELIAAMLTPAVMINVCGLLLLSTANRNSRIIDRIRQINVLLI
ncbi:DUF2721 domain-containing protein, partial [Candidatus Mcinerneyibacteriota bacterium]|nr:DUF2721 domain-containing protein [Candidatus Mcinerneyibacteriota bacterium]